MLKFHRLGTSAMRSQRWDAWRGVLDHVPRPLRKSLGIYIFSLSPPLRPDKELL